MSDLTPIARILGRCGHPGSYLARNVANNGVGAWCDECGRFVTKDLHGIPWLGKEHPAVKDADLETIPKKGERYYRRCDGPCGRYAICDMHHLAPRKFFHDADDWPKAHLCDECHDRWHTLVTPGLCTAYDASTHAAQLIGYLGLDRAAALTRALIDQGRAKRAGAA